MRWAAGSGVLRCLLICGLSWSICPWAPGGLEGVLSEVTGSELQAGPDKTPVDSRLLTPSVSIYEVSGPRDAGWRGRDALITWGDR